MRSATALLCAAALSAPLPALAQTAATVPAPTDPAAVVPPVKYESAFKGYRPFGDEKLAPWREVNDEVARVGGHVGIVGGAGGHAAHRAVKPAPAAPPAPAAKR